MPLKSSPNNVIEQLAQDVTLPQMVKVRQTFDASRIEPEDVATVVREQLSREQVSSRIRPGMRIGITCGSRGITNIATIIKAVSDYVKECGGEPFVFPAMGSHGGATAEGQTDILKSYGVTEENIGCPIRATMDTVYIGKTVEGSSVRIDRYASEADGVILCARIKPHTCFRGPYESGLVKMAVIGMGKQHGAEFVHWKGFPHMARVLPQFGRVIFDNTNIVAGVGCIENAYDDTCKIVALTPDEIWEQEPDLLAESKRRMGRIWIDEADVLVIDKIGKNISGDGMDPNITGTFSSPDTAYDGKPGPLRAQRCVLLDLTDETHGNATGIGTADLITKRLLDKIDVDISYPNSVTANMMSTLKIPIFAHTDESAIRLGVRTCNNVDWTKPRIIRIENSGDISHIWVSEMLVDEVIANPNMELEGELEDWGFDEHGNLW